MKHATSLLLEVRDEPRGSPTATYAAAPSPDNEGYRAFICPVVRLHNAPGTWVLGAHGAYYVNAVTRGSRGAHPHPGMSATQR